jgi:hypothetical protein
MSHEWVPTGERLPKPGVKVIVFYFNSRGLGRRTLAHHAPKYTIQAEHWDEDAEVDENEEGCFEPEGWWETPAEGEFLSFISDEVTHWMFIPPPPPHLG